MKNLDELIYDFKKFFDEFYKNHCSITYCADCVSCGSCLLRKLKDIKIHLDELKRKEKE